MRAMLFLLSMVVSGCVTYRYEPLSHDTEFSFLRERLTQIEQTPPAISNRGNQEWLQIAATIDATDGLSLGELNSLALLYSPRIRDARTAQRIASSRVAAAGLLPNPELFVGPRFSTESGALTVPGSLSLPLSLFGERSSRQELASAEQLVTSQELKVAERGVLQDVGLGYLEVLEKSQEIKIREEHLELSKSVVEWIQSLFQSGSIDTPAVFLALGEHDRSIATLEQARTALAVAESNLFELVGLLPELGELSLDPSVIETLRGMAVDSHQMEFHPLIIQAKSEYDRASAALKLEVKKQYPLFDVGLESETEDGETSLGFGLGFSIPLFDRNVEGIQAATEVLSRARDRYRERVISLSHQRRILQSKRQAGERLLDNLRHGRLARLQETRDTLLALINGSSGDDVLSPLVTLAEIANTQVEELSLRTSIARLVLQEAFVAGLAPSPENREEEYYED